MSNWTSDQRSYLSSRWAWDGAKFRDLTLAGVSCPNCMHFPAFKEVIVGSGVVGASTIETLDEGGKYPPTTNVPCKCGMHDKQGCGREGEIDVKKPPREG